MKEKEIYKKPEIEVIEMEMEAVIAESIQIDNSDEYNQPESYSPRNSFWDRDF